ncbi:MAG: NAD(+)/NADH kinase [Candidatus Aminicenantes bacterium]|nr:NAD(+)/NADH kinase [Candidatus Aminicenantes bacterium]
MNTIKHVGVVIKPHAAGIERILKDLIGFFEAKNITCILEDAAADKLQMKGGVPREQIPEMVDLVIVLGGDGTLLSIAHLAAQKDVPVMGVNLGRLGFLTEVPLEEMHFAINSFLDGNEAIVDQRQMLVARNQGETYYCLNDVVINKAALARMIQCEIWIDGKHIATSKADGLIIATPTGSTAYSLSAGGPIIYPNIPAIIIVPICPHTLTFRPMVISATSTVKIKLVTGGEEVNLTLDGQRGALMEKEDIVEVTRSKLVLKLVSSPKRNYFDLLQEKLGWAKITT